MLVCIDRIRQVDRQSRAQAALTDDWQRHDRTYDMALYIHHLGTIDHGAKLGAKIYDAELGGRIYGAKLGVRIYGAELPTKSPPCLRRVQDLGASNDGAKQCKLDASNDGAELRVQILKSYLRDIFVNFF